MYYYNFQIVFFLPRNSTPSRVQKSIKNNFIFIYIQYFLSFGHSDIISFLLNFKKGYKSLFLVFALKSNRLFTPFWNSTKIKQCHCDQMIKNTEYKWKWNSKNEVSW